MGDFLKTGAQWLARTQRKHCASDVTYQRNDSAIAVRATRGRSEWEVTDEIGVLTRAESRDFLIDVADLVIDGEPAEPAVGDRVLDSVVPDDDSGVYEVAAPASGLPPWKWADEHRITYRIHAKYIGLLSSNPT